MVFPPLLEIKQFAILLVMVNIL